MHGALIEAEILTSPSPVNQPGLNLGHQYSAHRCVNTSQVILKCFYVSQEPPKIFGAWGPNRSWDIDLPTFPCICSTWTSFWALALNPWVCQHLLSGKEMFVCVSGISKNLMHGALIEGEIVMSPLPMYLLNLVWFLALALCFQVCQHLQSGLQIFLCVSENLRKCLVHASTMRSEHNSISEVPTPDLLRVYKPVPDPQGVMCQHIEVPILGGGKHPNC